MLSQIRASKTQPHVVTIRRATPSEARLLANMAGDEVHLYDDMEFETF